MLRLVDVTKSYPGGFRLRADLHAEEGRLLALLGPSGCGKTSLLRLIAGLEKPDTGGILIRGNDVTKLEPNKRGIGMVFQDYALFPHLSVRRNVEYGLRMDGVPGKAMRERVDGVLGMMGVGHLAHRSVRGLSGGERQRVALARAIVREPSLLLMDEPFSALDQSVRVALRREMKALQRKLGITIILVTHNQEEAMSLADTVAVMDTGTIVQTGPPKDVYVNPATPYVAGFLGDVTRIPVRRCPGGCVTAGGVFVVGVEPLTNDGNAVIMFRPEDASMIGGADADPRDSLVLAGRIISVEMLGPYSLCRLATADGDALFTAFGRNVPSEGVEATIAIPNANLMAFGMGSH